MSVLLRLSMSVTRKLSTPIDHQNDNHVVIASQTHEQILQQTKVWIHIFIHHTQTNTYRQTKETNFFFFFWAKLPFALQTLNYLLSRFRPSLLRVLDRRQGDAISPKLLRAVLREVFKNLGWEEAGIKINGKHLNNLSFANGIVRMSKSNDEHHATRNEAPLKKSNLRY